jgi:hypothetical protein
MNAKSPNIDSFVITKNSPVELGVEFSVKGPVGAKVLLDGDLDFSTSLHPSETEFSVTVPFEEVGDHQIQIKVEGAAPGELQKLKKGSTDPVEEVTVADATWSVTVVGDEEISQFDSEQFVSFAKNLIALISGGRMAKGALQYLYERYDELPQETQEEVTTLSDFTDDESE